MTPPLPTSVLTRVAAGDLTAVQACMNRYGGLVWALARRLSPTRTDAEDAVQEIFLDLWKSAGRYDPGLSSETAFIAMVARRRLIDRLRQDKRRIATEPTSIEQYDAVPANDDTEVCGEAALAARALAQLKPQQRELLMMSMAKGMSHQQIASSTGMALGTVKTTIRQALIRVRQAMAVDGSVGGVA